MNIETGSFEAKASSSPRAAMTGPHSREAFRLRIYALLAMSDALALSLGFVFASLLRFDRLLTSQVITMCAVLVPIYLGVALNSRAYSCDILMRRKQGMFRALISLAFSAGAVVFIAFYLRSSTELSRAMLLLGTGFGAALICAGRFAIGAHVRRACGGNPMSEVVIKDGVDCPVLPGAYVLDAEVAQLRPAIDDPMMFDRLGRLLKNADRVVVACRPERRFAWAMALKGANINAEVLASEIDDLGAIGTSRYGILSTFRISTGPLSLPDRMLKRGLDMAIAVPALILVSPLMLIVAIAIRMETPGPVFFVQTRLGRGNRLFRMFKFRSMRSDAVDHQGDRSTSRGDARITRVGRFIRRTSIDELPQILNVVMGTMSLVGPRPHALGSTADDKLFWEVDQRYWHRHASKPGLTGLAQIRGFRGATHSEADLINRLQADLEYSAGWTIWRDISIIVATFPVLVHKNAF